MFFQSRDKVKKFDLNIEQILENWNIEHAVREIIANALDEQILSRTSDIKVYKNNDEWIIKDFGRGLKYEHFTQNENNEKLESLTGIIGKFGIGLKDALATFNRKGVEVIIYSKYGDFSLEMSNKVGFDDLKTLHVTISQPSYPSLLGTEFHLKNISDADVLKGKNFFLYFNKEEELETTRYGSVLKKVDEIGKIYINGVLVAKEDNFLFSYNITSINAILKKSLNRERTNVGRTAYAGIVKNILLLCESEIVGKELSDDLSRYSYGDNHDELKWVDVQNHAAEILNKYKKVVFVTAEQLENTDLIEEARSGGQDVVVIPTNLSQKIETENQNKNKEEQVHTYSSFVKERESNFDFKFITVSELSPSEQSVFNLRNYVFNLIGGLPSNVKDILISETMQIDTYTFRSALGLWDSANNRIIIKRSQLKSVSDFLGTLLHEVAHAKSGYSDATRGFERTLTDYLGVITESYIKQIKQQ